MTEGTLGVVVKIIRMTGEAISVPGIFMDVEARAALVGVTVQATDGQGVI